MNFLNERWIHLFTTLIQNWLSPNNLEIFADAAHRKGDPLANCWGFIDATVRPIARAGKNQRVLYSGHKKIHNNPMVITNIPIMYYNLYFEDQAVYKVMSLTFKSTYQ